MDEPWPTTLYHWSNPKNRTSIAERGLDATLDRTHRNCVYLDLECDTGDAGWEYDIWAVDVLGLEMRKDGSGRDLTGSWYEVTGSIAPARLTLVHQGETHED